MKRSLKDRFEESYKPMEVPGKNGKPAIKYVYCAPLYFWEAPKTELFLKKWMILGSSIFSLVLFVLSAMGNTAANSVWYVFVPAALAVCCHILELAGVLQFAFSGIPTTKMTYDEVVRIMDFAPVGRMLTSAAAAALVILFQVLNGFSGTAMLCAGGYFVCAVLAWLEAHWFSQIPVRIEKNPMAARLAAQIGDAQNAE